jgi:prolyl oligopeptidase
MIKIIRIGSGVLLACFAAAAVSAPQADEHGPLWLDQTYSPRALAWVKRERERSISLLAADPRFRTLQREAAEVLTDPSRPGDVNFIGDAAFRYWQDQARPLGVWQRTPKESYLYRTPAWETVIDLDALSGAEKRKWIFAGASCRAEKCLVRLSENGKDAAEIREFDLGTKRFKAGGFTIASSKTRAWWYDDDTLLVAPVLGRASLNDSLLPKTLRVWRRGTSIASAKPIFSIGDKDAMLSVSLIRAANTDAFVAARHIDFEAKEYHLITPAGASRPLPLPRLANIMGVHSGKLLLRPNVDWTPNGTSKVYPAGALVAISLEALMKDARIAEDELVYRPAGDDALRGATSAGGRLFVDLLHDYRSRMVELSRAPTGAWQDRKLPLPTDRFLTLLGFEDGKLLLREESPLVPDRVVLTDPATGAEQLLYARAPAFDASNLESALYITASRDGTPIAYTIVHPEGMKLDGKNPTLVYGYGGYDIPVTPRYEPVFGKLWMEKGGVYVHAYLRGGGEHGPNWHRGSMRKNRQQPFDDMQAVLRDLHRRGISSPQHSGIMGRSNGGLMVAAVMQQAPHLMNAAVVGGPLIDMLNFHELPPGGTWTAEYGDPRDPEMRPFLRRYSPMQNIAGKDTRYPVPLIITATDDDRVLPGHARRYAARLKQLGHDALYFEDEQGGHYWELAGGPAPGDWRLRSIARAVEFTYLWQRLGRPDQRQ